MALGISVKVAWSDILDAPFVHVAGRDVSSRDQVAQPPRCVRVDFVVVVHRILALRPNQSIQRIAAHSNPFLKIT
jgi:hypothetical protein